MGVVGKGNRITIFLSRRIGDYICLCLRIGRRVNNCKSWPEPLNERGCCTVSSYDRGMSGPRRASQFLPAGDSVSARDVSLL